MNYLTEVDNSGDPDGDMPSWNGGAEGEEQGPVISEHLDSKQRVELGDILQEFSNVLRNEPGRTSLAEHRIETEASKPLRQPPYRLPHTHRQAVLKELEEMEANGIINPQTVTGPPR